MSTRFLQLAYAVFLFVAAFALLSINTKPSAAQAEPPIPSPVAILQRLEADEARIAALEVTANSQSATIAALQREANASTLITQSFVRSNGVGRGTELTLSGVNLHIVNGTGQTETENGLGNLIVGYDEMTGDGDDVRTGSHNIVTGEYNDYSSDGGIIGGNSNSISGPEEFAVGYRNSVSNLQSVVSGGMANIASGQYCVVSGGIDNDATGPDDVVSGGTDNVASGLYATVSGGGANVSSGDVTSISGGNLNVANSGNSSISGGYDSTASGIDSSISGGAFNTASGLDASVSGGQDNTASGSGSAVSGGAANLAGSASTTGDVTSVSGGQGVRIKAVGEWAAGDFGIGGTVIHGNFESP